MSTTIHPHPEPQSVSPNHFDILGNRDNIVGFFSQNIFVPPLSMFLSPFHIFTYFFTAHCKLYLPSPLFLYYHVLFFFLAFYFISSLQTWFPSLSSLISHLSPSLSSAESRPSSWSGCSLSVPLSSLVSLQALLSWICLVCQPVKLLRYSTSCW